MNARVDVLRAEDRAANFLIHSACRLAHAGDRTVRMSMRTWLGRCRLAAFCLVTAVGLAETSAAQGGYTTEKRPDLGLTFPRARDYEEIPIPPSEEFKIGRASCRERV